METKRTSILNTFFNNLSMKEILGCVDAAVNENDNIHIVSLNVDQVMKIEKDDDFRAVYNSAELSIVDGTPLVWISKIFNKQVLQKIPGPYLAECILEHSAKNGYKVFLLGAKEGVAATAAKKMANKYKGLNVVGTYSPPFGFEKDNEEIYHIIELLRESKADVLIVGLGAPKQEKFVHAYKDVYDIPVSLSLGAAIDFMAGNIKRAPGWVNKIGMEWFYRFILEPRRLFKRYFIDDMKIIGLMFKYKS